MQGALLIDKPSDWTSFDVVNYIRKIVASSQGKKPKNIKVGHTGTLDPFATGLLVLLIGKEYTRRAQELTKLDKTYKVTMLLGQKSTTGDPEGTLDPLVSVKPIIVPSVEELTDAIQSFVGEIKQVPPAFSAIKIGGQRAYKLAREGKQVVIEPRRVTIHSLDLKSYSYPEVNVVADVSSGTYMRTLVEDIAQRMGMNAYTSALRRTKVGSYMIDEAVPLTGITAEIVAQKLFPLV